MNEHQLILFHIFFMDRANEHVIRCEINIPDKKNNSFTYFIN